MKLQQLAKRARLLADEIWSEAKEFQDSLEYERTRKIKSISSEIHNEASKLEKMEDAVIQNVHES